MGTGGVRSAMDVFVYGTLTDPARAGAVLEEFTFAGSAELVGLQRVDGEYPTLAPGGSVTGRILRTDAVARLDRYEGVDRGLYVRVSVPVERAASDTDSDPDPDPDSDRTVETYVGDPTALDAPAEWPGSGPFPDRVAAYLSSANVAVRIGSEAAPIGQGDESDAHPAPDASDEGDE